jgi:hypothetical protein
LKIENPFESGHIKNYILAYASIVVIMILFFIASTLFHDVEEIEKKEFEKKQMSKEVEKDTVVQEKDDSNSSWTSGIKIMEKSY